MKMAYFPLLCVFLAAVIGDADETKLVGGPCTYATYSGKAKITHISKTEASKAQIKQGAPYEGYEIWFSFTPDKPIENELVNSRINKEQLFQLMNSWYAGEKYIQQYGIATGKVYACTVSAIKKGTCTPVIFELKGLDRTDYFESQK